MKKTILVLIVITAALLISPVSYALDVLPSQQTVQSIRTVVSFTSEAIRGEITDIAELADGSLAGVGSTEFSEWPDAYQEQRTPGDEGSTALAFKFANDGKVEYIRTFGGNDMDRFNNITPTSDGGFIASGYAASKSGGDFDKYGITGYEGGSVAFMVKYDKNGNVLWAKSGGEKKIRSFGDIIENSSGDLIVFSYHINQGSDPDMYITRLDKKGKSLLTEDFVRVVDADMKDLPKNVKHLSDGSFIAAGTKNNGNGTTSATLSRFDKNGKLVFTKSFGGDGQVFFNEIVISDNKIIVTGNFVRCSKGKDFSDLGIELPAKPTSGGLIVMYDLNGKALHGNILSNPDDEFYHLPLKGLAGLNDGDALVQVFFTTTDYFVDPISGSRFTYTPGSGEAYLYRVGKNAEYKHLYKITSDGLFGPYNGIYIFKKTEDGTFRIISNATENNTSKVRVLDVVDKFELEQTIDSVTGFKKTDFTSSSWSAFMPKYESAVSAVKSKTVTQKTVNKAVTELKLAIAQLAVNDGTKSTVSTEQSGNKTSTVSTGQSGNTGGQDTSGLQSENISDSDLSAEQSTESIPDVTDAADGESIASVNTLSLNSPDSESEDNSGGRTNPAVWIILAVAAVGASGILVYFLYIKKRVSAE